MRKLGITIASVSLLATSMAWADDTAPLAPGRPAGVHSAQAFGHMEWLVFGGIAALTATVLIATSGGRSSPADNTQGVSVVTTTTTG